MRQLPKVSAIITSEFGDGFKRYVLPSLTESRDLIVTHKMMIEQYKRDGVKCVITNYHCITKLNSDKFNRVIIDCRLPHFGTKGLANLVKFCKGKVVLFIGSDTCTDRMPSVMCILQSAKIARCGLKVVRFSRFQHMRGTNGLTKIHR